MKIKKQLCGKSNIFKRPKKPHSDLPTTIKVRGWRLTDNVKSLQQKSTTTSTSLIDESFYNAIKPVLVIGQLFGILPVINITAEHPMSLRFAWRSLRFFYALIVTISCGLMAALTFYWTFSKRVEFGKMVPLMFYVTNFSSFFCFLLLAQKWPALMMLYHEVEKKLPPFRTNSEKQHLRIRMRSTAAIILTMSFIEHILSVISGVAIVVDCPKINNTMKAYYLKSFPQVFNYFSYSLPFSIYIKFIHVTSTFAWAFTDLFIMMISCGLSEKFKLINERMLEEKGKFNPPEYYSDYRRYYRSACDLVSIIDDKISSITILSISNNLFFICVQLLNSMEVMTSVFQSAYFWFSLIYLIIRTLAVSLFSAEINDESKRPVEVFRAIPRESWCLEIRRFSEEVNFDVVALSGKKFFFLTRSLVLSVAGTIITYELVLIQFKTNDNITDYDPCWSNITTIF